jgi:hypothetical protein
VIAGLILAGALLIFASSAGAKPAASRAGAPSAERLMHKLQSTVDANAMNVAWPIQSPRAGEWGAPSPSLEPPSEPPSSPAARNREMGVSPGLDDLGLNGSDPALDLVALPDNAWGRTVDAYIVRLAGAWEMIKHAGDLDFQLNDRTEMSIKFRDPMNHPRALLVLRTDF